MNTIGLDFAQRMQCQMFKVQVWCGLWRVEKFGNWYMWVAVIEMMRAEVKDICDGWKKI